MKIDDREYECTEQDNGSYEIRHGSYMTSTQPVTFPSEEHKEYFLQRVVEKFHQDIEIAEKMRAETEAVIQQRLEEKRKREQELFGEQS